MSEDNSRVDLKRGAFQNTRGARMLAISLALAGILTTVATAYYPYPLDLIFGKEILVEGDALDVAPTTLGQLGEFDTLYSYNVDHGIIYLGLRTIRVKFTLKAISKDGNIIKHRVDGEGRLQNGVGYLKYRGENIPDDSVEWFGVLVLNISAEGPITGIFLTENPSENGRFIIGTAILRRLGAAE